MNDTYESCNKVTMAELCRELLEETATKEQIESGAVSIEQIENKLWKSNSSVVKKLKEVGLDLLAIAGEDPRERFDALKIFKLFYKVEKDASDGHTPIKVITILNMPNINDLNVYFPKSKEYRHALAHIYQEVRSQVPQADIYEQKIDEIDGWWIGVIRKIFQVVYQPNLQLDNGKFYDRLSTLAEKLWNIALGKEKFEKVYCENRVMTYTYIIFFRYKVMAENRGWLCTQGRFFETDLEAKVPLRATMAAFLKKRGGEMISWEGIEDLRERTITFMKNPHNPVVAGTIACFFSIEDVEQPESLKKYKNFFPEAVLYAGKVLKQCAERCNLDYSDGVPFDAFIATLHSIFVIDQYKLTYIEDYNGNKHAEQSLMRAIKGDEPLRLAAFQEWVSIFLNRLLVLMGRGSFLRLLYRIEHALLEIELSILAGGSLNALLEVHEMLFSRVCSLCAEHLPEYWYKAEETFFPF